MASNLDRNWYRLHPIVLFSMRFIWALPTYLGNYSPIDFLWWDGRTIWPAGETLSSTKYCRAMYATHYAIVATEFERFMNDGRKLHIECSVGTIELGTFIQGGSIRVSGPCGPVWYGPTNHIRLGDYPHHMNKRVVYGTRVISPWKSHRGYKRLPRWKN